MSALLQDMCHQGNHRLHLGSAKSFYEECKIVLVLKEVVALPMAPPEQERSRNPIKIAPGKSGLAYKTCTIEGEGEKIYLGRVGTIVIYSYTDIGKEIVGIISDRQDVQTVERYHSYIHYILSFVSL
jgi:hypothetical protein